MNLEGSEALRDEESGPSILELRHEKEKCIENMDFERSSLIESQIRNRSRKVTHILTKSLQNTLKSSISACFREFDVNIENERKSEAEKELTIRKEMQKIFEKMQEKHIYEIESLERERSADLLKEASRPSVREIDLKEKAKQLARSGRVKEAMESRSDAEAARKDELQRREEVVNKSYDRKLDSLSDIQEKEILAIEGKLEERLLECRTESKNVINSLQKKAANSVKSSLKHCISLGRKSSIEKSEISDALTKFAQELLWKLNRSIVE